jgi:transcriptional regulator EpsA
MSAELRIARDSEAAAMSAAEAFTFIAALGEAMRVRRRVEFFAWTQGALQSLIPHGVLLCGLPRSGGGRMFFDYFYHVPIHPNTLSRLCHPRQGLAAEMVELWLSLGAEPMSISTRAGGQAESRLAAEMQSLGLGEALVHGIPNTQMGAGAHYFLSFVALNSPSTERHRFLLELLAPHVYNSYCRALARERPTPLRGDVEEGEQVITDREVEILKWVREGKSNQEIGMILSISPLTVKNHVQKILRKLQASNRAQAVSKAISMKLLGTGYGRRDSAPSDLM